MAQPVSKDGFDPERDLEEEKRAKLESRMGIQTGSNSATGFSNDGVGVTTSTGGFEFTKEPTNSTPPSLSQSASKRSLPDDSETSKRKRKQAKPQRINSVAKPPPNPPPAHKIKGHRQQTLSFSQKPQSPNSNGNGNSSGTQQRRTSVSPKPTASIPTTTTTNTTNNNINNTNTNNTAATNNINATTTTNNNANNTTNTTTTNNNNNNNNATSSNTTTNAVDSAEFEELNRKLTQQLEANNELKQQLEAIDKEHEKTNEQYFAGLRDLVRDTALADCQAARKDAMRQIERIGFSSCVRTGINSMAEVWSEGSWYLELVQKRMHLDQRNLQCVESKKIIAETKRKAAKEKKANENNGAFKAPASISEYNAEQEIVTLNLEAIKKEMAELEKEEQELKRAKILLSRELKRIKDEDDSKYKPINDTMVLNNRYALMCLLGRGGFSEVHKAYDLQHCRLVACKIHQVNSQWSDAKKENYIKHATREYEIHKDLDNEYITKLHDVFEVDDNSFCTVMEHCNGHDLDFQLKQLESIPEREARCKIVQIIHALKYLNEAVNPPIIHYDLKPANILQSNGQIKLTDFGLSKQHHQDGNSDMELTSQGAGTYWYLPPECFETSSKPRISSKVDVWSVGIIFYQCLYGRRPFGHNQSQQSILQNQVILKAKEVQFPTSKDSPKVSQEAKAFIKTCLTYKMADRPDVLTLFQDPYLQKTNKR